MKGFSLVETIVVVFILGLLAAIVFGMVNTTPETKLIACAADLVAMEQMTEQYYEQSRPWVPTQEDLYNWMENRRKEHYHYLPNNSDLNKGHGNDIDLCDEENPGASLDGRNCLEIKWAWVCDHNHVDLAKYVFITDAGTPIVVPLDAVYTGKPKKGETRSLIGKHPDPFLKDLDIWLAKDPGLRRFIR